MAFDKDELKQLREVVQEVVQPMLDNQASTIMYDVKVLIKHELAPIKNDLDWVKNKLKDIEKMESEDVAEAYKGIKFLKKQIKLLEIRIQTLELSKK